MDSSRYLKGIQDGPEFVCVPLWKTLHKRSGLPWLLFMHNFFLLSYLYFPAPLCIILKLNVKMDIIKPLIKRAACMNTEAQFGCSLDVSVSWREIHFCMLLLQLHCLSYNFVAMTTANIRRESLTSVCTPKSHCHLGKSRQQLQEPGNWK